jgi:hypothetical protein
MPFWPADWDGHAVLISGLALFLESVLSKLSDHVSPLIFYLDTVFAGHQLQGILSAVQRSTSSWFQIGLQSTELAHATFGGTTLAVHNVSF